MHIVSNIFFWQLILWCLRHDVCCLEEVPEGPGYGLKTRWRGCAWQQTSVEANHENQEHHT